MKTDERCDYNRFHPTNPPCQNAGRWAAGPTVYGSERAGSFISETTWCDTHRHSGDIAWQAERLTQLHKLAAAALKASDAKETP